MIHQYKMDDLNIVLDIHSGSVHLVDEATYQIISMMVEQTSEEDIYQQLKASYELDELKQAYSEVIQLKYKIW